MAFSSWKTGMLGDFLTLQRGYDLPKRERKDGPVPIVSSAGVTGSHVVAKVKGPGVVTGRYGTLGEVFFVKEDFWPLNTTLYVKDFKGSPPLFVSYFLRTLNFENQNTAGAVPGVNRNALHLLQVQMPPLETQRKIASILSVYDDLIENNTRRIKILEEMARMIYREWFVNFRFPGHEQVMMVDSPLGKIPEGWEVGRLDDALVLQRGFDLPKKDRVEDGDVPVYAATGLNGKHSEAKVKGPCVITGRSGSLGTVLYIGEDFWPLNTALWVKEFKKSTPIFAYYLLSDMKLAQYNAGAAVPTLNRNDVHGLQVILPPARLLDVFESHLTMIFKSINVLGRKNQNLRQTRDLLLPKLISGEIEV